MIKYFRIVENMNDFIFKIIYIFTQIEVIFFDT